MIIDLLDKYSTEEYNHIIDVAKRWSMNGVHRGDTFDMYKEYNAPYWGDGSCEHGECINCTFFHEIDGDDSCEEYIDEAYNNWFENIITLREKCWIERVDAPIQRQLTLMKEEYGWEKIDLTINMTLLTWLNDNDISYCIVKGLLDFEDHIFHKKNIPWMNCISEFRLRFGIPSKRDIEYATTMLGWKEISLSDLTEIYNAGILKNVCEWIGDNSVGIVIPSTEFKQNNMILFESDVDIMATKLKWIE